MQIDHEQKRVITSPEELAEFELTPEQALKLKVMEKEIWREVRLHTLSVALLETGPYLGFVALATYFEFWASPNLQDLSFWVLTGLIFNMLFKASLGTYKHFVSFTERQLENTRQEYKVHALMQSLIAEGRIKNMKGEFEEKREVH
jgi:hypothetical protein